MLLHKGLHIHFRNLKQWMLPQRVSTSILSFPSESSIYTQPYGVCLIIAPWNYPIVLSIQPLISAIAAENCSVVKLSEHSPQTSVTLKKMLESFFDKEFLQVIDGGKEETTQLLENEFDKIFFTGSTTVGKIVQKAAAQYLTPTVLELGEKSACIVTETANLDIAAQRICFGKFINAGQTCVAPDYVWVHRSIKEKLITKLSKVIQDNYGNDIQKNLDYARIINNQHLQRLKALLTDGKIRFGGRIDENDNFIEPTILEDVSLESPLMQEEIFGPLLPIIPYDFLEEIIHYNHEPPKPLAVYIFTSNKNEAQDFMNRMQFGGGRINGTLEQIINPDLPFGGFEMSGMGCYHGKYGFNAFTHYKAVVRKYTYLGLPINFYPYKKYLHYIKRYFRIVR